MALYHSQTRYHMMNALILSKAEFLKPQTELVVVVSVALHPKSTAMVMAGWMISSPNQVFSWASLNKQLTSTSCTYIRLLLTTTLLEFSRREENDRRNYFMINLHESMGSNLRFLDLPADSHLLPDMLPTALCGPVN